MHVIRATSVSAAYRAGMRFLHDYGEPEDTRNGRALVAPGPVTTVYEQPWNHILGNTGRDANPFFHLFEALWMLTGRRDVALPAFYASTIAQYSDDGEVFHGAYGYRWRHWFGFDQLEVLIDSIRENPMSRRHVLTMWSPDGDMVVRDDGKEGGPGSKDLPCNMMIKFWCRKGSLHMSVFNRSNDIIWGCYGANVVHFSMLLMYVAERAKLRVGVYNQVSCDFHAYVDIFEKKYDDSQNTYRNATPEPYLLGAAQPGWIQQISAILDGHHVDTDVSFIRDVVIPMQAAFLDHRVDKDTDKALRTLYAVPFTRWVRAGIEWLRRRAK